MEVLDGSLWYRSAAENAGKLHLAAATLIEMHSRVSGWMGTEWIKRQESRRANRALPIGAIHSLFTALRSSSVRSIVEVAEVATYLAAFDRDPAFQTILKDLRSDKFASVLFELAMAYRWKWAGAAVALSPILQTGRVADFSAAIGQTEFLVEASSFPADDFNTEALKLQHVIKTALDAVKPARSLAVELIVERPGCGDVHGAVNRAVRVAARRFSGSSPVVAQLAFGTLTARDLGVSDAGSGGDWSVIAHGYLKEPPTDGTLYDAHLGKTVGRTHSIYIRTPPRPGDLYDALLKKFENERRQLSGSEAPRVILLDATGVKSDVLAMDFERVNDTIGQRLLGLEKVSALWLLSRGWFEEGRVGYRAVAMSNPRARVPLPSDFVETVNNHEWRYDLASGKKIDWDVPAPWIDDS